MVSPPNPSRTSPVSPRSLGPQPSPLGDHLRRLQNDDFRLEQSLRAKTPALLAQTQARLDQASPVGRLTALSLPSTSSRTRVRPPPIGISLTPGLRQMPSLHPGDDASPLRLPTPAEGGSDAVAPWRLALGEAGLVALRLLLAQGCATTVVHRLLAAASAEAARAAGAYLMAEVLQARAAVPAATPRGETLLRWLDQLLAGGLRPAHLHCQVPGFGCLQEPPCGMAALLRDAAAYTTLSLYLRPLRPLLGELGQLDDIGHYGTAQTETVVQLRHLAFLCGGRNGNSGANRGFSGRKDDARTIAADAMLVALLDEAERECFALPASTLRLLLKLYAGVCSWHGELRWLGWTLARLRPLDQDGAMRSALLGGAVLTRSVACAATILSPELDVQMRAELLVLARGDERMRVSKLSSPNLLHRAVRLAWPSDASCAAMVDFLLAAGTSPLATAALPDASPERASSFQRLPVAVHALVAGRPVLAQRLLTQQTAAHSRARGEWRQSLRQVSAAFAPAAVERALAGDATCLRALEVAIHAVEVLRCDWGFATDHVAGQQLIRCTVAVDTIFHPDFYAPKTSANDSTGDVADGIYWAVLAQKEATLREVAQQAAADGNVPEAIGAQLQLLAAAIRRHAGTCLAAIDTVEGAAALQDDETLAAYLLAGLAEAERGSYMSSHGPMSGLVLRGQADDLASWCALNNAADVEDTLYAFLFTLLPVHDTDGAGASGGDAGAPLAAAVAEQMRASILQGIHRPVQAVVLLTACLRLHDLPCLHAVLRHVRRNKIDVTAHLGASLQGLLAAAVEVGPEAVAALLRAVRAPAQRLAWLQTSDDTGDSPLHIAARQDDGTLNLLLHSVASAALPAPVGNVTGAGPLREALFFARRRNAGLLVDAYLAAGHGEAIARDVASLPAAAASVWQQVLADRPELTWSAPSDSAVQKPTTAQPGPSLAMPPTSVTAHAVEALPSSPPKRLNAPESLETRELPASARLSDPQKPPASARLSDPQKPPASTAWAALSDTQKLPTSTDLASLSDTQEPLASTATWWPATRRARPTLRLEINATPSFASLASSRRSWTEQIATARTWQEREAVVDRFLAKIAPDDNPAGDPAVAAATWSVLEALHVAGSGRTLGRHFWAHHPQTSLAALRARCTQFANYGGSRFALTDAVHLLRLRRQAMTLLCAEVGASLSAYAVHLRCPALQADGLQRNSAGGEASYFAKADSIRFILRKSGATGVDVIAAYPVVSWQPQQATAKLVAVG